jgi:hypothetical protein
MKKQNIKKATETSYGRVVCPHCETVQNEMIGPDTESGIYKCDGLECSESFLVTQELVDRGRAVSSEVLDERIEDLTNRMRIVEKELGIK